MRAITELAPGRSTRSTGGHKNIDKTSPFLYTTTTKSPHAGVAQWLVRLPSKQYMTVRFRSPAPLGQNSQIPRDRAARQLAGPITLRSPVQIRLPQQRAVVVQLARTSPCQGEGRQFKSGLPLNESAMIQKLKYSFPQTVWQETIPIQSGLFSFPHLIHFSLGALFCVCYTISINTVPPRLYGKKKSPDNTSEDFFIL